MDSSLIGIGFALLAALGFASTAVLARPAAAHMSLTLGTFISVLASLAVMGAITAITQPTALFRFPLVALAWFALLGLLNFAVGRPMYYNSIDRLGVSRAAPIVGATPLVAGVAALVVYGETITWPLAVGALAVVAGVTLILREQG